MAHAFARDGARVFLAGRTKAKLDKVAAEIRSNGGAADTAVVDALDTRSLSCVPVTLPVHMQQPDPRSVRNVETYRSSASHTWRIHPSNTD